jgi:hypothetical protein
MKYLLFLLLVSCAPESRECGNAPSIRVPECGVSATLMTDISQTDLECMENLANHYIKDGILTGRF